MSWQIGRLRDPRRSSSRRASSGTSAPARLADGRAVAALAALAVAGRLVLAPIPNVVATTDVALITGYALGGGAGLRRRRACGADLELLARTGAVDAVADGGLGAGRGARRRARRGRGPRSSAGSGLAVAAAFAGFAYGALLDLSVMVSYGGEQSLDRYLALSARGIPFNVAHAVGNFGDRLRRRTGAGADDLPLPRALRVHAGARRRPLPRRCCVALVIPALLVSGGAAAEAAAGAGGAARWPRARAELRRRLRHRAGLPSSPDDDRLGDARAGGRRGQPARRLRERRPAPVEYLRDHASGVDRGDLERTILALAAPGSTRASFGGRDLVAELRDQAQRDGSFEGQVNLTAFGDPRPAPPAASRRARALGQVAARAQNPTAAGARAEAGGSDPTAPARRCRRSRSPAAASRARQGRRLPAPRAERRRRLALPAASPTRSRPPGPSRGWSPPASNPGAVTTAGTRLRLPRGAPGARDGHYRYSASSDQTPVWVTAQALLGVEREAFPVAAGPAHALEPGGLRDACHRRRLGPASAAGPRLGGRAAPPARSSGTNVAAPAAARSDGAGAVGPAKAAAGPGGGRPERPAAERAAADGETAPRRRPTAGRRRWPLSDGGARGSAPLWSASWRDRRSPRLAGSCWYRPPSRLRRLGYVCADGRRDAIRTRRTHKAYKPEPVDRARCSTSCSSSPAGRRTTT